MVTAVLGLVILFLCALNCSVGYFWGRIDTISEVVVHIY